MLEQLKSLVPEGESSFRFSYLMLEKALKIPKKEVKVAIAELSCSGKISIVGNIITINSLRYRRCQVPEQIKKQVFAKFKNRCAYCGDKLTSDTRTVDHIVPLASGGANSYSNFFPACVKCNKLKAADDLYTFKQALMVEQFYFEKILGATLF